MEGVVYVFVAVANKVPAVAALYQLMVWPDPGVAVNTVLPDPQTMPPVATGAEGTARTDAIDCDLVDTHPEIVFLEAA